MVFSHDPLGRSTLALRHLFVNTLYKETLKTVLFTFSPTTYAWQGGVALSKQPDFIEKYCVTRSEYEENGRAICNEKFDYV